MPPAWLGFFKLLSGLLIGAVVVGGVGFLQGGLVWGVIGAVLGAGTVMWRMYRRLADYRAAGRDGRSQRRS